MIGLQWLKTAAAAAAAATSSHVQRGVPGRSAAAVGSSAITSSIKGLCDRWLKYSTPTLRQIQQPQQQLQWQHHQQQPGFSSLLLSARPYSSSSIPYLLDFVHTQQLPSLQLQPAAAAAAEGMQHPSDPQHPSLQDTAEPGTIQPTGPRPAAAGAVGADPSTAPRGRAVAVALSGGVDSAVTALLLQQQGYKLFGVYMHNWDAADEAGAGTPACTSDADLADAQALCKALDIPLYEADFVSRYWNEVFETFLQGLSRGLTPNPDLACNSHIKFGALLDFAREKGADVLATGHYARLGWTPATAMATAAAAAAARHDDSTPGTAADSSRAAGVTSDGTVGAAAAGAAGLDVSTPGNAASSSRSAGVASAGTAVAASSWQPVLLTGSDPAKDQSYFLASLTAQQLAHAMFPVGHLTKTAVREVAAAAGLTQATKRSSAGICFIGRRSFGKFLETFLQPMPGVYVDADTGASLGPCSNMLAVTVGQKAIGLGGQKTRVYVAGKDLTQQVVYVVAGQQHPALYSSRVLLQAPNWVAGQPPAALQSAGGVSITAGAAGGIAGLSGIVPGAAAEAVQEGQAVSNVDVEGSAGAAAGVLQCQYQARYRQAAANCTVRLLSATQAAAFQASKFCTWASTSSQQRQQAADGSMPPAAAAVATPSPSAGVAAEEIDLNAAASGGLHEQPGHFLVADLAVPLRGIAPGQIFVMYDGPVCLGSATIVAFGPTLAEQ